MQRNLITQELGILEHDVLWEIVLQMGSSIVDHP